MLWVILLRAAFAAITVAIFNVMLDFSVFELLIMFLIIMAELEMPFADKYREAIICAIFASILTVGVYFLIKLSEPQLFIVFFLFIIILRLGYKEFKERQNNP